jgi:hypothetical protein
LPARYQPNSSFVPEADSFDFFDQGRALQVQEFRSQLLVPLVLRKLCRISSRSISVTTFWKLIPSSGISIIGTKLEASRFLDSIGEIRRHDRRPLTGQRHHSLGKYFSS